MLPLGFVNGTLFYSVLSIFVCNLILEVKNYLKLKYSPMTMFGEYSILWCQPLHMGISISTSSLSKAHDVQTTEAHNVLEHYMVWSSNKQVVFPTLKGLVIEWSVMQEWLAIYLRCQCTVHIWEMLQVHSYWFLDSYLCFLVQSTAQAEPAASYRWIWKIARRSSRLQEN